MALVYNDLTDRIQLLVNRDDMKEQVAESGTTVNMMDYFVENTEKRFYRSEAARTPPFEKVQTFNISRDTDKGYVELQIPSDYFSARYFIAKNTSNGDSKTLARVSPEQILNNNTNNIVSIPTQLAYGSNNWIVENPAVAIEISAYYYGTLGALKDETDADNVHWLLQNATDLMVYWTAVEAALYYGEIDPAMIEQWELRGQYIHDQIVEQEIRQQVSGSPARMNRPYSFNRRYTTGF